jgi:hypothetical protein
MKIKNLTPHIINLMTIDGHEIAIKPEANPARVATSTQTIGEFDGVALRQTVFGEVENLPDPEEDTIFIVSQIVLGVVRETRPDVFAPDTGKDALRDDKGMIKAVRALTR